MKYTVSNNGKKTITIPGSRLEPGMVRVCELTEQQVQMLDRFEWMDLKVVEIPKKKRKTKKKV